MTVNDTDKFLVNRSGSSYHLEAQNLMAELLDDDLMLVNRDGKSYKATGAEIKDSLGPKGSILKPTILAPGQNAGVGDLAYTPKTSAITRINNNTITVTNDKTYNFKDGADMGTPISETFRQNHAVEGIKPGAQTAVGVLLDTATGNRLLINTNTDFNWTVHPTSGSNTDLWRAVAYGKETFVAVANQAESAGGYWVMTSPDGENWTGVTAPAGSWQSDDLRQRAMGCCGYNSR